MSLRPLEHVDEIRDLLYGPGNGRPRAARCTIPVITRIRVDGRTAIVYDDPHPFSSVRRGPIPESLTDQVRLARQVYASRQIDRAHATDSEAATQAAHRRMRTEANLAWLRGLKGIER